MFCSIELIYKICVQHSYLFIYRWIIESETINYAFVIAISNELTHSNCSFCLFSVSQCRNFFNVCIVSWSPLLTYWRYAVIFSTLTSGLLLLYTAEKNSLVFLKRAQKIHWNCYEKLWSMLREGAGCWKQKRKGQFHFSSYVFSSSHIYTLCSDE